MIKAIEGVVTKKEPAFVILKTNSGVSYGIFISLFCSAKLSKGEKAELAITQIIREDANLLYGFLDANEQKMFEMLIKLNGIGASTAMAVCSSLSSQAFTNAIISGDADTFKSVPSYQNEALLALEALGFKREKIVKILPDCKSENTSDLIKEALKKLG